MKLLFVTQVMDRNDAVLGAYHTWVAKLAERIESITVICLYEGEHDLPDNVRVYSLGKEKAVSGSLTYAIRFKWLAWRLRNEYDAVFVHMNQEYLLIAGPLWRVLGKRIYLWRNHYAGTILTDIAAAFCTKVFCTSKHSYTAKYKKTVFMPVGIDEERFYPDAKVIRESRSVLFLARIAPSKRPDMFIEALGLLIGKGVSFIASVYGSPLPEHERYYESLKQRAEELGLHGRVRFKAAVPNTATPDVYRAHEIFVNCSPSGMFDKTLFEAAAAGCLVLARSDDLAGLLDRQTQFSDPQSLAAKLEEYLSGTSGETLREALSAAAGTQSLSALVDRLLIELT